MKPTPFVAGTDLEPIPFSSEHCALAKELKEKGLDWHPHVGCFVWDEKGHIKISSPFPNRIYFILNLGHFLRIFETIENMRDKLVWLPTWHQAKIICKNLNIGRAEINAALGGEEAVGVWADAAILYKLISKRL
ncbi:MAG: hypothetical protein PVH02_00355 [Desulfobacteraceae bacterium]